MRLKVNNFCSFDLKTGVLIIGMLFMIRDIVTLVIPYAGNDVACEKFFSKDCKDLTAGETSGLIIWGLINGISTILMISGSQKFKPVLILPAILLTSIGLIVTLILVWGSAIREFKAGINDEGAAILIAGHAGVALMFYFLVVIYSRYKELRDQPVFEPQETVQLFPL